MRIEVENPAAVVKRAFYLAWQACGGPAGMGWLQDNPAADEEAVWNCVLNRGDYPGGNELMSSSNIHNRPGKVYGDYVFGRMMKLRLEWDSTSVKFDDSPPRPDYQGWCHTYPTVDSLIRAAVASLQEEEITNNLTD